MFFINRHKVPQDAKVTYCRIVCNIRSHKKETHRVPLKLGGDKLTFDGLVSSPTYDLTTSKLHRNSVISTTGTKYLVVDVKNFYLNNAMEKHVYYRISLSPLPQDVIDKYNLMDKQINIFLYVREEKGMYGLVQKSTIAHTALK